MLNIQEDKLLAIIIMALGSILIGVGTRNFQIGLGVFFITFSLLVLQG